MAIEANYAALKGVVEGKTFDVEFNCKRQTVLFYIKQQHFSHLKAQKKIFLEILLQNSYYSACSKQVM